MPQYRHRRNGDVITVPGALSKAYDRKPVWEKQKAAPKAQASDRAAGDRQAPKKETDK